MRLWGFPSTPEDVLEYHSGMVTTWLERGGLGVTHPDGRALSEDEKLHAGVYLREWYPYIYLWGPRGNVLAENYNRLIQQMDAYKGAVSKGLPYKMMLFYAELSVSQMDGEAGKAALHAYGEFAKAMSDAEIWSPVITCTDTHGFAFEAIEPDAFPTHIYWETHFHRQMHDAMNMAFKKTKNQMRLERGMHWFEMFVLGGEHVKNHPELGQAYAQHVAFCQENDLLP